MTSDATHVSDVLVRAAMAGNRHAVERLLELVQPHVVRYCRSRLGPSARSPSPDDVAQEVCLAVLTGLPRYRFEGRPFLAFVHGVAAHKVIDAHRAAARTRSDPDRDIPDVEDTSEGPEQRVLRAELSDELRALLDELPDVQREILVLRVALGLSTVDTAAAVGSSPTAVRVAQHRGLARLRRAIANARDGSAQPRSPIPGPSRRGEVDARLIHIDALPRTSCGCGQVRPMPTNKISASSSA